jgi:hypothetical protein
MDVLVFIGELVAIALLTYPPDTQAIPFTLPLGSNSLSSVLLALFSAPEKVLCVLVGCNRLECSSFEAPPGAFTIYDEVIICFSPRHYLERKKSPFSTMNYVLLMTTEPRGYP